MLILLAAVCAFVLTVLFGRIAIPMLRALKAGQSIREIGPKWHNSKAGTPTMGGIMFILASLICTVAFGWKDNIFYKLLYNFKIHCWLTTKEVNLKISS